jgi:cytochrome P450
MAPMFGDGIFTQEGDSWSLSRSMLKRHLNPRIYDNLDILQLAMDDLFHAIDEEARSSNGVVDLQPLFLRFALDTTTAFLLGKSIRSLKDPKSTIFARAFNKGQDYIAKRLRLLSVYWFIDGIEFRQCCRQVMHFVDEIISLGLLRKDRTRTTFLDSLAAEGTTHTALRGQIVNILTAGRDTTACSLTWAM